MTYKVSSGTLNLCSLTHLSYIPRLSGQGHQVKLKAKVARAKILRTLAFEGSLVLQSFYRRSSSGNMLNVSLTERQVQMHHLGCQRGQCERGICRPLLIPLNTGMAPRTVIVRPQAARCRTILSIDHVTAHSSALSPTKRRRPIQRAGANIVWKIRSRAVPDSLFPYFAGAGWDL